MAAFLDHATVRRKADRDNAGHVTPVRAAVRTNYRTSNACDSFSVRPDPGCSCKHYFKKREAAFIYDVSTKAV